MIPLALVMTLHVIQSATFLAGVPADAMPSAPTASHCADLVLSPRAVESGRPLALPRAGLWPPWPAQADAERLEEGYRQGGVGGLDAVLDDWRKQAPARTDAEVDALPAVERAAYRLFRATMKLEGGAMARRPWDGRALTRLVVDALTVDCASRPVDPAKLHDRWFRWYEDAVTRHVILRDFRPALDVVDALLFISRGRALALHEFLGDSFIVDFGSFDRPWPHAVPDREGRIAALARTIAFHHTQFGPIFHSKPTLRIVFEESMQAAMVRVDEGDRFHWRSAVPDGEGWRLSSEMVGHGIY